MAIYYWVNDLLECNFQIKPPNSLACLLHWNVQIGLLALLSEEQQEQVKSTQEQEQQPFAVNLAVKRERPMGCNVLVDWHCHRKRWLDIAQCGILMSFTRWPNSVGASPQMQ